ncbi:hypothetical protein JW859_02930 [bacterium]|nr:hypothetical protein [bacterium]
MQRYNVNWVVRLSVAITLMQLIAIPTAASVERPDTFDCDYLKVTPRGSIAVRWHQYDETENPSEKEIFLYGNELFDYRSGMGVEAWRYVVAMTDLLSDVVSFRVKLDPIDTEYAGRDVLWGWVFYENTEDEEEKLLQLEMIKEGHAKYDPSSEALLYRSELEAAQKHAKKSGSHLNPDIRKRIEEMSGEEDTLSGALPVNASFSCVNEDLVITIQEIANKTSCPSGKRFKLSGMCEFNECTPFDRKYKTALHITVMCNKFPLLYYQEEPSTTRDPNDEVDDAWLWLQDEEGHFFLLQKFLLDFGFCDFDDSNPNLLYYDQLCGIVEKLNNGYGISGVGYFDHDIVPIILVEDSGNANE